MSLLNGQRPQFQPALGDDVTNKEHDKLIGQTCKCGIDSITLASKETLRLDDTHRADATRLAGRPAAPHPSYRHVLGTAPLHPGFSICLPSITAFHATPVNNALGPTTGFVNRVVASLHSTSSISKAADLTCLGSAGQPSAPAVQANIDAGALPTNACCLDELSVALRVALDAERGLGQELNYNQSPASFNRMQQRIMSLLTAYAERSAVAAGVESAPPTYRVCTSRAEPDNDEDIWGSPLSDMDSVITATPTSRNVHAVALGPASGPCCVETTACGGNLQPPDWERYAFFNPLRYVRNLVDASAEFELMLVCWAPGQQSEIHNHGNSHCWLVCLQGMVEEAHYQVTAADEETFRMGMPGSLHSLGHEGATVKAAMSDNGRDEDSPDSKSDGATSGCLPRAPLSRHSFPRHMLKPVGVRSVRPSGVSYINDRIALHSVGCPSHAAAPGAVTLHLYVPPIRRATLFQASGEVVDCSECKPGFFSVRGVRT